LLDETIFAIRAFKSLPYVPAAEDLFRAWRASKIKGVTHDLRIAAICVVHSATLVSRNRRDFESLPGLKLEVWA
jgi:tRNA(fMet)-specific endonuclease VapC